MARGVVELLTRWGIRARTVADGAAALLHLYRERPGVAILGGRLPGVSAPVLAEVIRRTAELGAIRLIRVATLDEPGGAPEFDAEAMLEPGDLPEGLAPLLEKLGIGRPPARETPVRPAPSNQEIAQSEGAAATPAKETKSFGAPPAKCSGRSRRAVSSDPQIAEAERLARIIVSDIILYNEGKFASGVRDGNVAAAVKNELTEGMQLFEQRIPPEIREKRDFLAEELSYRVEQMRSRE
ncbi:MAG: hypothetical protein ACE5FG_12120 [Myxococcota bacterium]